MHLTTLLPRFRIDLHDNNVKVTSKSWPVLCYPADAVFNWDDVSASLFHGYYPLHVSEYISCNFLLISLITKLGWVIYCNWASVST
jgi:hypothetical protein